MKKILCLALLFMATLASAQDKKENQKAKIVEASCGQCQFKMQGKGCELAIRTDGKTYFVDGSSIDAHGDAHAIDGFCLAIKKAVVSGKIENGRFKATSFTLAPKKESGLNEKH